LKKRKSDRRDAIQRTGDTRVKLASAFVGGVGAQRRDRALFADWNDSAVPVDRRRRGVDNGDFPAVPQPPGLIENVDRAGEIYLVRPQPFPIGALNRRNRG